METILLLKREILILFTEITESALKSRPTLVARGFQRVRMHIY